MPKIVEVHLRPSGRPLRCDTADIPLRVNDYVIVDTGNGLDVAKVTNIGVQTQPADQCEQLIMVIRQAQPDDLNRARQTREKEALTECREMVLKMHLKMKLLAASYDLKSGYLTIFFSARERVDFRGLVWKLSRSLETRVELRQVGSRDEAKLIGGLGRCGYPLCCQNFLTNFSSVSIKMAKEQNLALNPMKIAGLCGRLLCCLAYENKGYVDANKRMPKPGQEVLTPLGKAKIISTNILKETVTAQFDNEVIKELTLDQLA